MTSRPHCAIGTSSLFLTIIGRLLLISPAQTLIHSGRISSGPIRGGSLLNGQHTRGCHMYQDTGKSWLGCGLVFSFNRFDSYDNCPSRQSVHVPGPQGQQCIMCGRCASYSTRYNEAKTKGLRADFVIWSFGPLKRILLAIGIETQDVDPIEVAPGPILTVTCGYVVAITFIGKICPRSRNR